MTTLTLLYFKSQQHQSRLFKLFSTFDVASTQLCLVYSAEIDTFKCEYVGQLGPNPKGAI